MTEGNQIEVEGKIHTIRKKIIHYYDLREQAGLWKNENSKGDHEKLRNEEEFEKLLSPRK